MDTLTRREDETYSEYIERVAVGSELARGIKIRDIEDHLETKERIKPSLVKRYNRALERLQGG